MQFEDKEYYGEIWFPEDQNKKEFCILKREHNKIVLTTNLWEKSKVHSADLIHGVFTGLGYTTFINNKIIGSSSGMIITNSYSPEYCLVGKHLIENPKEFKTFEASIVNSDLRKWLWRLLFDLNSRKNSISYEKDINEDILIDNDLTMSIYTWTNQKILMNELRVELRSKACLKFNFKEKKSIVEVINLYNKFQKFLLFFHGSTKQFDEFDLMCEEGCNSKFQLFYNDGFHNENSNSLLNLNYEDLKEKTDEILKEWFKNEDILICVDKILNNSLSSKLSFSQKFINAYIALESFLKRFSKSNGKDFKVYLEKNKELILAITEINVDEFDSYIRKLIRTRDYYVHDNIKQKEYFHGIDLLYEAIMIESLVSILILKELTTDELVVQKIIRKVNTKYVHSKQTNLILSRNILE